VVGLEWSKDPEGNPGGSVATGRVSNVRQVKGDDPQEKGYSGPPGWGMGVGPITPSKVDVKTTSETPWMMEASCKVG
jgi:hypothetical protein